MHKCCERSFRVPIWSKVPNMAILEPFRTLPNTRLSRDRPAQRAQSLERTLHCWCCLNLSECSNNSLLTGAIKRQATTWKCPNACPAATRTFAPITPVPAGTAAPRVEEVRSSSIGPTPACTSASSQTPWTPSADSTAITPSITHVS